jgi:hypothetical protein
MRPVVPASSEILVFQYTSERPEFRGLQGLAQSDRKLKICVLEAMITPRVVNIINLMWGTGITDTTSDLQQLNREDAIIGDLVHAFCFGDVRCGIYPPHVHGQTDLSIRSLGYAPLFGSGASERGIVYPLDASDVVERLVLQGGLAKEGLCCCIATNAVEGESWLGKGGVDRFIGL